MGKQPWLWISVLGLILLVLSAVSCSTTVTSKSTTRVTYPWDLYNLVDVFKSSPSSDEIDFVLRPENDNFTELRRGKIEGILLGREPSAEETAGLQSSVIGYDATCIFIDRNSFVGGEYWLGRKTPVRKTIGLQALSSMDLSRIFQYWILKPQERWQWHRYTWQPLFDPTKEVSAKDANGWFKETFEVPCSFRLNPGKYDTQTVIYQKLGLDEKVISARWSSYSAPKMDREERILAFEYMGDIYAEGSSDYAFKIGFASRQVTLIALSHIHIEVLPIDGIHPLENSAHIYDGTYKFSRKIHLITRNNPDNKIKDFLDFCLSKEGQTGITLAGYLPVERNGN